MVPITDLQLDPEVAELFEITFKSEPSERPTALDLLNHPKIVFGKRQTHMHVDTG